MKAMNFNDLTLGIIGLGQIGASIAAGLKGKVKTTIGYDINSTNTNYCLSTGYINSASTLERIAQESDVVAVATPVNQIVTIVHTLLHRAKQNLVVFDVGSVKAAINENLLTHPMRGQFVSSHPMAGNSGQGPQCASANLFSGKLAFICDEHLSTIRSVEMVAGLWELLGARIEFADSTEHDRLMSFVSHLPQLAAYALANSVANNPNDISNTLKAASSGFDSMTRLAQSSANMWIPIIHQNKENILNALSELQQQLRQMEAYIRQNNYSELQTLIARANSVRIAFENQQNQNIINHDKQKVKN